jgi:hypothetical protein
MKYILILYLLCLTLYSQDSCDDYDYENATVDEEVKVEKPKEDYVAVVTFKGIEYGFTKEEKAVIVNKELTNALVQIGAKDYKTRAKSVAYLIHITKVYYYAEEDSEYYDEDEQSKDSEKYKRKYALMVLSVLEERYKSAEQDLEWRLNALKVMRNIHNMFWKEDAERMARNNYREDAEEILERVFREYQKETLIEVLVEPQPFL